MVDDGRWNSKKKIGTFFFSKYFAKIKNHLFLLKVYKDFSNFSKSTRFFFLIVFGPLWRIHKISFRIFWKWNWKFFLFQNILLFWKKKCCVELEIWYFSILIWAAKRGGRSFFTKRELFLQDFSRYLPQPEEITSIFVLHVLGLVLHVLCLSHQFSSHGVPGVLRQFVVTHGGWWWMVDDGSWMVVDGGQSQKRFFLFWEKKGCVELEIWYFSILIWAAKRGGRSFFTRRDFLRYLPQPEEITHFFCFQCVGPSLARTIPSLARTVLKPPVLQPRGTRRSAPTCSDGRWMVVDGGWRTLDGGWSQERFFNFAESLQLKVPPKLFFSYLGFSVKTFL